MSRFNYVKQKDTRDYNYRVSQDNVLDKCWQQEFNYRSRRDGVADNHWYQEYNLTKHVAASRNSGGVGCSKGTSSSRSSPSLSSKSSLNGYTRNQINWYSNPNNALYAYGQKKEGVKKAPPI